MTCYRGTGLLVNMYVFTNVRTRTCYYTTIPCTYGNFEKNHSGPIRGRMTDTDGSWETPHPSSVTDGMGGPTPPSVMRTAWYRWPVHPIRQQSPYPAGRMTDGKVGRDGCLFPQKKAIRPSLHWHQNVGSRGGRAGS